MDLRQVGGLNAPRASVDRTRTGIEPHAALTLRHPGLEVPFVAQTP